MKNKIKSRIILGVAIFCFLYIIFALRPLSTELHLAPDWTAVIDRIQNEKEDDELIPFRLGQTIGYFTEDGRIVKSLPYPFNAAISNNFYTIYSANNSNTIVYDAKGQQVTSITAAGFPFFADDRIFLFLPGGSALAQYSKEGDQLWEYEYYAPITSFASGPHGSVVGFADGFLISFLEDGTIDQSYFPGGSEIQVIMGAGISDDGRLIGCVSGQKQQRFIVSERNGEHSRIIFHEYLPKDFKHQVLVRFNKKADTAYYNFNGGLGIVDVTNSKSAHIPIDGVITQIEESTTQNLMFVLSHAGANYTITVIEPFDHVMGTFTFPAKSSFLQIRGNAVFVGKDNKVSRMTISKN